MHFRPNEYQQINWEPLKGKTTGVFVAEAEIALSKEKPGTISTWTVTPSLVKMVIDKYVENTNDHGVDCLLIGSTWKIVEVSKFYKTYTNLTNLTIDCRLIEGIWKKLKVSKFFFRLHQSINLHRVSIDPIINESVFHD